jgi:hypothetical protein
LPPVSLVSGVSLFSTAQLTTNIFGAFSCLDIDPDDVAPGQPSLLRTDYSIACDSPRYQV